MRRWSLVLILAQHRFDAAHKLVRVLGRDAVEPARFDFHRELVVGCRLERCPQGRNLVNDASEGPDVTLFVILLVTDLLRAHVVGGADVGVREDRLCAHHARQAKVTQLHVIIDVQKDVTWLEISMEDFAFRSGVAGV